MAAHPQMMAVRRQTVEHPFGNLKQWIMGNGRLLLQGLQGATTEIALATTAYNLKRVINIVGVQGLLVRMA